MYLFPTFLDDVDEYRACEAFWARLVERAAQASGTGLAWVSWIPKTYANGTPFPLDGNPIYDAKSSTNDRGVYISQWAPGSEGASIYGYIEEYPPDHGQMPLAELAIQIVLTTETAKLAEECLTLWTRPDATVRDVEAFIDQRFSKPRDLADS